MDIYLCLNDIFILMHICIYIFFVLLISILIIKNNFYIYLFILIDKFTFLFKYDIFI